MDFGTATLQHCNTFALLDTIKFNLKHCTKVSEIFSRIKGIKSEDFCIRVPSMGSKYFSDGIGVFTPSIGGEQLRALTSATLHIGMRKVDLHALDKAYSLAFFTSASRAARWCRHPARCSARGRTPSSSCGRPTCSPGNK